MGNIKLFVVQHPTWSDNQVLQVCSSLIKAQLFVAGYLITIEKDATVLIEAWTLDGDQANLDDKHEICYCRLDLRGDLITEYYEINE